MTIDLNTIFAIVSAEKDYNNDSQNSFNTFQMSNLIKSNGFDVTQVSGKYKDKPERALIVTGRPCSSGWTMHEIVKALAMTYDQESFIICDGTGEALLVSVKDNDVLGRFRNVRKAHPTDSSYTELPNGNRLVLE